MEISRRVCAVRMTFHKFLLARYEDGVCIRDTLTILGTSINDPVTPVCGNMTSWITTFAVKERTRLTLAMVLQGIPAYTFSIGLTQLACDNIPPFQSPTYAGIRNAEAEKYIPTTTTTEAPTTTEDPTTVENPTTVEGPTTVDPTTATDTTEETTTVMNVVRGTSSEVTTSESVVTTTESVVTTTESVPTTLMPGKLPMPPNDEVLIRAALPELESEEEEGVYTGSIGTTPAISAFRRTFELLKVNEKCWQYYDEPPTFRVIGGFYANLNEYPWQVALVYKNKFFCGGSLISDRHILTASHCVFGSFSRGLDKLRVSLGDHDLATRNETKNIVSKVKTIHWHLHYNPHSTVNDIAVIELENPVDFSYSVSAVKLPTDLTERYEKANATITGWGRYTSKSKTTSTIMKEHTAPLVNTTLCVQAWNKFPGINASYINHVCLNVTMGTPCHIGVVSFGFPLCTNVGLPAVFTRVTHYKSWIDMNLAPLNFV
ncbi:Trypsin-like 1 [Homarus americanus]|uniref:Trypsin-like 1 n=1 Tax=Homarus americanus TaxID=6706 RepID=A0A8J5JSG5_HOMAM|nr:Trypsin-like 1 [Homarus americanus]